MNICYTSTFEGTFEDFNSVMAELRAEFPGITDATESAEIKIDKEGWCKVITIANVVDFNKMQELMASPKVAEFDEKYRYSIQTFIPLGP